MYRNGGPAFPTNAFWEELGTNVRGDGMTLRDYFAAKAMMQTMVEFDVTWKQHGFENTVFLEWAAERAYAMADAMLKVKYING